MAGDQVDLTLETLEDDDGVKLASEINDALVKAEEHIQKLIAELKDNPPEKPIIITARVELTPRGQYSREVSFEVETKFPKLVKRHNVLARSKDGRLTVHPSTQQRMAYERDDSVTPIDEAASQ